MSENLLNAKQAADRLAVNHATIRKWANSGKLPGTRVGNVWLFTPADVDACKPRAKSGRPPAAGRA